MGGFIVKKIAQTLLVCCALITTPAFGAIRYEFQEITRTQDASKTTSLVARAVVDGNKSRLDVISGNRYHPGNYIISHGENRIYIVQPAEKAYLEYETGTNEISPDKVQITNPKVNFQEVKDPVTAIIAGFPTKHFRLQFAYDMTVKIGTITIIQHVDATIEKWTTNAFDHLIAGYRDNTGDLTTGNPAIDQLVAEEATKITGLSLKEETITRTTAMSSKTSGKSTRERKKEMLVSLIEEVDINPSHFAIPIEFSRVDAPKAPTASATYLTMTPDGQ